MVEVEIVARIKLLAREGETQEELSNRLYDLMYDGLCNVTDHECEFWIEEEDFHE